MMVGDAGGVAGVSALPTARSSMSLPLMILFTIASTMSFLPSAVLVDAKKIKIGGNNGRGGKNADVSDLGPPGLGLNCEDFGTMIEVEGLPKGNNGGGNNGNKNGNSNANIPPHVFQKRNCAGSKWTGDDGNGDTITIIKTGGKSGKSDIVLGSIVSVVDQVVHQIRPTADGGTAIFTTASKDFKPEKDPHEDDHNEGANRGRLLKNDPVSSVRGVSSVSHQDRKLQGDGIPEIRVLVPWTQAAECAHSSLLPGCAVTDTTADNMIALIELAIEETNDAYVESGVNARLVLAHAYRDPDNYIENDTSDIDGNDAFDNALDDLAGDGDGLLDTVHSLRDTYGAGMQFTNMRSRVCLCLSISHPISRSLSYSLSVYLSISRRCRTDH